MHLLGGQLDDGKCARAWQHNALCAAELAKQVMQRVFCAAVWQVLHQQNGRAASDCRGVGCRAGSVRCRFEPCYIHARICQLALGCCQNLQDVCAERDALRICWADCSRKTMRPCSAKPCSKCIAHRPTLCTQRSLAQSSPARKKCHTCASPSARLTAALSESAARSEALLTPIRSATASATVSSRMKNVLHALRLPASALRCASFATL